MKKAVFIFFTLLAITGLFAQERIAVFPFEDRNNVYTKDELDSFYAEFSDEFANKTDARRFTVLTRDDLEKIINMETKFQLSEYSSKEKTAELQRVLNAQQILYCLIVKVSNEIRITVSRRSFPELSVLRGGKTISVTNKNQLFGKIPELVQAMANEIAGGVTTPVIQPSKLSLYEQLVNATENTTITVIQDTPLQNVVISKASSIILRGDTEDRTIFSINPPPGEYIYIMVKRGVILTLESITLKGISVLVEEGGTLVMNNKSSIKDCTSDGVHISEHGTFTMNGGSITNCSAGVAIFKGTFTMSSGSITNNKYFGVYVLYNGIFTMNAGNINNNSSYGVLVEEGRFTMSGGSINNNSSSGVSVRKNGIFIMNDGRIANNNSSNSGGGVQISQDGKFYMKGGIISGNIASGNGGGVYLSYGGSFSMTGGTVYGSNGGSNANIAIGKGNAVYDTGKTIFSTIKNYTIYRY